MSPLGLEIYTEAVCSKCGLKNRRPEAQVNVPTNWSMVGVRTSLSATGGSDFYECMLCSDCTRLALAYLKETMRYLKEAT